MKILYTILLLIITVCILTNSQTSLFYAMIGLDLWFNKMVPSLFPFMILSGIMIRMNLTKSFSKILSPIIKPLFGVSDNVCYAMLMGFLCGFPMGAKTIADLLKREMLSLREASFLLAFCNNIGPVYFCSFVLPLLQRQLVLPYLVGMYGLPLLYGWILRYTVYRDLNGAFSNSVTKYPQSHATKQNLLDEVDDAITSSIQSILVLGGYMIFFNLLNLLPHMLLGGTPTYFAPVFEITGGLMLLKGKLPLYGLLLLSFGGMSCIAQTNSCIKGTELSLSGYTLHKLILMALTGVYYLGWYLLFPSSFLR